MEQSKTGARRETSSWRLNPSCNRRRPAKDREISSVSPRPGNSGQSELRDLGRPLLGPIAPPGADHATATSGSPAGSICSRAFVGALRTRRESLAIIRDSSLISTISYSNAGSIAVENTSNAGEVACNKPEAQAKGIEQHAFLNALRLRFRLVSPVPARSNRKSGTPIQRWSINNCQDLGGWWRSRRRRPRGSGSGSARPRGFRTVSPSHRNTLPHHEIRQISVEFAEDSP